MSLTPLSPGGPGAYKHDEPLRRFTLIGGPFDGNVVDAYDSAHVARLPVYHRGGVHTRIIHYAMYGRTRDDKFVFTGLEDRSGCEIKEESYR